MNGPAYNHRAFRRVRVGFDIFMTAFNPLLVLCPCLVQSGPTTFEETLVRRSVYDDGFNTAIWQGWKKKNTINNRDVTPGETTGLLEELIRDLVRKSWNATRFMEGRQKLKQRAIKVLWAEGRLTDFDLKEGPSVDFT